ncbi:endolytic transglycosylase MltG [Sphingorhabdus sp. M41]|uniref:endolytic transglycosylase MltG n=1 Tax=Sphingorhabdus sp. M41 TaxID=1806885 RepID=UPI00078E1DD1|nr:endolytic transglycosylase MltG [Sphingorhabdus sp. M41]AMO71667.1 aminodeoxychorismate lyase [Sphingorhabdus sp. M41]
MRRLGCLILVAAAVIAVLLAGNFLYGWNASGPLEEQRTIVIKSGSSLSMAAQVMESEGVIKSADSFLTRAKILGGSEPIKAGEFEIPAGASNALILDILQGGKSVQRLITVPEGTPSIIVYEKLMAEKLLKGDIPVPAEGSILPDSYSFERGEQRAAVVQRMQKAMSDTLAELWPMRTKASVVNTPEEAIILASIVEKETALARERRTVAAVYGNRVERNMMLQADPTIIYPITRGKPLGRRIRQSEIAQVNDYNTYAMVGLPKGPIANPGRASIEAVLNPARSEALYFVADGKGGHIFAKTLKEHNANVEKWFAIRRERGEM